MKTNRLLAASLSMLMLPVTTTAIASPNRFYEESSSERLCGYKDDFGKVIVAAGTYDDCGEVSDGLAYVGNIKSVIVDGSPDYRVSQGFINESGKLVLPIKYDVAEGMENYHYQSFNEGLVAVYKRDKDDPYTGVYGYMDKSGKMVIPYGYKYAGEFNNGVAIVQKSDQFGTIDKSGKTIVPAKYDFIMPYTEGLAIVSLDQMYGAIDTKGKLAVPLNYNKLMPFSEGMALYNVTRSEDDYEGVYGYLSKDGSNVINAKWSDGKPFMEGLAAVRVGDYENGKWGIINKSGKYIVNPKYDAASIQTESDEFLFDDGYYQNGKMYMYDLTNKNLNQESSVVRYTIDKSGKVIERKIFSDWDAVATEAVDKNLVAISQGW